jgi:cell surface protein (putative penicillin-binding protein)
MEEEMDRMHLKIEASIIACVIMILLCSCNLFVTDKDKFYLDKDLNYTLSRIDIKKTGPDIVIPEKVGDRTVWRIYLADPYYSKIDSLDISNVKELESFTIKLFGMNTGTKLKKLDFSKNKKLKYIDISKTTSLKKVIFNNKCEYIYLKGTSIKSVNLKNLKELESFIYRDGPLEELDTSNNPNLESIKIADTNIKRLDVTKNPKLKYIIVDEGTQIIGPTKAKIEYNKRTE